MITFATRQKDIRQCVFKCFLPKSSQAKVAAISTAGTQNNLHAKKTYSSPLPPSTRKKDDASG